MGIVSMKWSEFYANYLKQKQTVFSRLEREVFDQTRHDNKLITCHKGCAYCCSAYVEATLKECKAIVYYLYQNENVLISFLRQYSDWRSRTRQLGDLCTITLNLVRKQGQNEETYRNLADAFLFYKLQNIACPLLDESTCSIYYSRPFSCAAYFATTPPEWCSPLDPRKPKIYKGSFADDIADLSLYSEQLKDPGLTLMPVKVYEILQKDRAHLSQIHGLPDLEYETIDNPRIAAILQTYI